MLLSDGAGPEPLTNPSRKREQQDSPKRRPRRPTRRGRHRLSVPNDRVWPPTRGRARKDLGNLPVSKRQMRTENDSNRFAKVAGNRKVTFLIKIGRCEARPSAIHPTATHRTAHHPDHIAMSVISSAVAVFLYGPPKLRNNQHHRFLILRTQLPGKT